MPRILLAAVAALAVLAARPALACGEGCKSCPHHKAAAAAEKGDPKGATAQAGCPCAGDAKACTCAPACQCAHCAAKKDAAKKAAPEKS